MITKKYTSLPWWQIASLAIVLSAVGGLASGLSGKSERKLYNRKLRQAPWAPPAWVFGPAWVVNNVFLLLALQRLLGSDMPQKRKLLILQGAIWLVFFSFGYIYFNKKSPVLAAAWTFSDAALAFASFAAAAKTDKKLAMYYLPLLAWTGFASTLAGYQALTNDDPVVNTKALIR